MFIIFYEEYVNMINLHEFIKKNDLIWFNLLNLLNFRLKIGFLFKSSYLWCMD